MSHSYCVKCGKKWQRNTQEEYDQFLADLKTEMTCKTSGRDMFGFHQNFTTVHNCGGEIKYVDTKEVTE